jgi:hypothetical protein
MVAPHESLAALVTLELFGSVMRFLVPFQLVTPTKPPFAILVWTQVRFFSGVNSDMRFQVRGLIVPFITVIHRTRVFLDSRWQYLSRAYAHHSSRFVGCMNVFGAAFVASSFICFDFIAFAGVLGRASFIVNNSDLRAV